VADQEKIIVVGGAGYVGSAIATHLAARRYLVSVLDCLVWEQEQVVRELRKTPNVCFLQADMADATDLLEISRGAKAAVVAAALVGDPITKKYPEVAERINIKATEDAFQTLIDAGIPKLVFLSTCSNYGLVPDGQVASEESPLNPVSLYARQKVAAESRLLELCEGSHTDAVILRLSTAFGDSLRMRFDLTVAHFVKDAILSGSLQVFDADTWRPYCHVEDIAVAVVSAIEAPNENVAGQIFNVGNERNNLTKRQIAEMVQLACPKLKISFVQGGEDARDYRVLFGKARAALGFEANWRVSDYIPRLKESLADGRYPPVLGDPNFYGNYVLSSQ
jgi:nucleoside-diphosphate-sugar epimerase